MQKPLIILASARKKSDTKDFVEMVFSNSDYDLIDLLDFQIAPFDYDGNYPDNDEFMKVIDKMLDHHVIVFATPVYWYAMSGSLKNFFDRFTDIVTIKKTGWPEIKRQINIPHCRWRRQRNSSRFRTSVQCYI